MVKGDIEYVLTDGTTPTDDVGPIGGDPGDVVTDDTASNILIHRPPVKTTEDWYRGIALRRIKASVAPSFLSNARFANRAGALINLAAGPASVVFTSPLDAGSTRKVRITGKVSGVWQSQLVNTAGLTPSFSGYSWDANSVVLWEYLINGMPSAPYGNMLGSINGQICAFIYGDLEQPGDGNTQCNALYTVALAPDKNTTLTAANRKTNPSGIADEDFAPAVKFPASDQSLAIPGNTLEVVEGVGDFIYYCIKLWVPANVILPAPVVFDGDVVGDEDTP